MLLPDNLRTIVAELRSKANEEDRSINDRDLCAAIADQIEGGKPIDRELQDQYVRMLARENAVDKYGK